MIKQIYFDAGGVLFTRRTPDGDGIAQLLGFPKEQYASIVAAVIELQSPEESEQFLAIRTLEDEYAYLNVFHRKMCDLLSHAYDDDLITKLSECRIKADFVLNPKVLETVRTLSREYKLSILSNALPSRRHHELLIENIGDYFDPIILSFEVGMHKPGQGVFDYALQKASCPPHEVALIDDKLENLQSAQEAGFGQCILFSKQKHADFAYTDCFDKLPELLRSINK